ASTVGVMRRMLTLAGDLAEQTKAAVYFLAPHVKVAAAGLEYLYGQVRERGVVFLRTPDNGPDISIIDGQIGFRIHDPVARAELSLVPDLVISEEPLLPGPELAAWAEIMGLPLRADGFVGPDNVLYWPALTNRSGIYAIGPVRGTDDADLSAIQMEAVIADIRRLLATSSAKVPPVSLESGRCASCLTCLRICPHGAIEFDHQPSFHPLACQACGACAAVCPGQAIHYEVPTEKKESRLASTGLAQPEPGSGFEPHLTLFGCQRSALTALESVWPPGRPGELTIQPLPCGGNLDVGLVLEAFRQGADGILIAVCHEGNCRSQTGSLIAGRRSQILRQTLKTVGFDEQRLELVSLAPNMGADLTRIIDEFRSRISSLGPA
ncbi:MAG: hydrogenase iron-sulfur subunit, partial [Deltaproteobacteria bacterium]|nr:hydrogenase iron-sulfur subunit [Deltaproteobacteria bacterium]